MNKIVCKKYKKYKKNNVRRKWIKENILQVRNYLNIT